ncbi:Arc family DNA-binding protein [Acinetobacter johnsonii]|jgi:hypothetical protein|uniref:Arc family DNA-binding protein n=1 Tax=Acinetobacter johnsonii TaxID=40214 RepID=UPI0032B45FB4
MSENQRDPQYKLRWSEELRGKIAQSAKEHNRSMNADIVARLEQSFEVNQQQESTITDLTDQIKHLKMSFDILSEALREKKTP